MARGGFSRTYLEGFKDGQSLTWEGTMGGEIEFEYDGLANSFAMQTEFQLEWTSDKFKRAHFSGDYQFESADKRITVDGTFAFNYPCYSDPVGVQLSGTLNIANFQEGELQAWPLTQCRVWNRVEAFRPIRSFQPRPKGKKCTRCVHFGSVYPLDQSQHGSKSQQGNSPRLVTPTLR